MFPPVVHAVSNPFITLLLRLLLPCIILFTVLSLLAHGYSSGPSPLHDLLLPTNDCPIPCFLGIRPGVTHVDTALEQLRAEALIRSILPMPFDPVGPRYTVDFLPALGLGQTAQLQLMTRPGSSIVEGILLSHTAIRLSDIIVALGQPPSLALSNGLSYGLVTYVGFYPQYQLYVLTIRATCASGNSAFWRSQQPLVIGIISELKYSEQRSYYQDDLQTDGGWMHRLHKRQLQDCFVSPPDS